MVSKKVFKKQKKAILDVPIAIVQDKIYTVKELLELPKRTKKKIVKMSISKLTDEQLLSLTLKHYEILNSKLKHTQEPILCILYLNKVIELTPKQCMIHIEKNDALGRELLRVHSNFLKQIWRWLKDAD